ncbi:hypothetical protein FH972_017691 [Carpinus fangiana]|uniref:Uncharacterized protein n=1 Tax=Carpinus fangiana TaxID=176857 RepID=A0A5N6RLR3_9ROSI|nr:hypothetical protein FH972_017691 [Carpinus fangiana]
MDRLISLEPSILVAVRIEHGHKCSGELTLRNVMPQAGIISPLATLTIEIVYHLPPGSNLPHSFPLCDDAFLLHSVVVPGAAIKEPSSMFDAVPNDWFTTKKKQVFIDSGIKIMFVGPPVLAQLVADDSMDDIRDVLEKSELDLRAVDMLLEFEPDVEAQNRSGSSPLEAATAAGESLIVELLLAHRASTERSESAASGPIHLAAGASHIDVLRLLLLKGANVDALTNDRNTALHLALEEGRRDRARHLLASGARTDVRNTGEGSQQRHPKPGRKNGLRSGGGVHRLFDALRLGDSLCVAARKGEVRTIQKLVENGAAINGRDQHGWTALHRASFKGKVDAVRALMEKGIDIDAKDEDGYTALHCAVEAGQTDVIEMLVKKGADVEARTNKGVTPLQIAESLHYIGVTRILIHGGATKDNMIVIRHPATTARVRSETRRLPQKRRWWGT